MIRPIYAPGDRVAASYPGENPYAGTFLFMSRKLPGRLIVESDGGPVFSEYLDHLSPLGLVKRGQG